LTAFLPLATLGVASPSSDGTDERSDSWVAVTMLNMLETDIGNELEEPEASDSSGGGATTGCCCSGEGMMGSSGAGVSN